MVVPPFTTTQTYDEVTKEFVFNTNIDFIPQHGELFREFIKVYDLVEMYTTPSAKPSLMSRIKRICKLCGKTMPEVTFNKTAHIIPQLMGNKHGISDMECDFCNSRLSKYENDLANYLGLSRTLAFTEGQGGVPKFKSPDKKLEVFSLNSEENKRQLKMVSEGLNNPHFTIDKENKEFTIQTNKQPFVPINVYKALLKIPLMFLTFREVENYESTLQFLLKETLANKNNPFLFLFHFYISGPPIFQAPFVFLYKKKADLQGENCPEMTCCIYFQNYMYQFFLPFGKNDLVWIQSIQEVRMPIMPPFVGEAWVNEYGEPRFFRRDMNISEIVKNEAQTLILAFEEHEQIS